MVDTMTIATYDNSAKELAAYFAGNESRLDIIREGLASAGKTEGARVVEVGCGDGRDAVDIIPLVAWYEGFDPSIELIRIARSRGLATNFEQADALSYAYPQDLDAIFGFASYLHLDKRDFVYACQKAATSLRSGGTLVMTLKERDSYQEELIEDEFGKRKFYYYDDVSVRDILESQFEVVKLEHHTLKRKTAKWLVVIARKK
jgi:SAM-dependent methyltransferase